METRDFDSWKSFVEDILNQEGEWAQDWLRSSRGKVLYRGHSDARWSLETTLERHNPEVTSTIQYYRAIRSAKSQIDAHMGHSPTAKSLDEYVKWAKNGDLIALTQDLPGYEYKAYLRHHGCPSPLLDWSRSPYIAAFFAFRSPQKQAGRVAIYAFCEYFSDVKHSSSDGPAIVGLGPYVATHTRHFLQQCEYTVCLKFDVKRDEWTYASHETVFAQASTTQDLLWKFTLPTSERDKVLSELERFNLNAFSLFGSEDSLVETVAAHHLHPSRFALCE